MRCLSLCMLMIFASCASSMERVQDVRERAPDWYEARKQELFSKSYPDIYSIPEPVEFKSRLEALGMSEAETLAALARFSETLSTMTVLEAPSEMLAWADENRRAIEGRMTPPEFLTDEDVEALKAVFDTPRGRL